MGSSTQRPLRSLALHESRFWCGMNKKALKGKGGVFFTLISLTLVAILLVIFARNLSAVRDTESTAARIRSIDSFLKDVESSYLPLSARASGYRAVLATTQYLNSTQQYISFPQSEIGGVLINGTLASGQVMTENTLSNFTSHIMDVAKETYSIDLYVVLNGAQVGQTSPWQIEIEVNVSLLARADVGNWSRDATIRTQIPIAGFLDPQYLIRTGAYEQPISQSNITNGQWNISVLDSFISEGRYLHVEGSGAPSFLERFKESPEPSECCGIESTINPEMISPSNQQE